MYLCYYYHCPIADALYMLDDARGIQLLLCCYNMTYTWGLCSDASADILRLLRAQQATICLVAPPAFVVRNSLEHVGHSVFALEGHRHRRPRAVQ